MRFFKYDSEGKAIGAGSLSVDGEINVPDGGLIAVEVGRNLWIRFRAHTDDKPVRLELVGNADPSPKGSKSRSSKKVKA